MNSFKEVIMFINTFWIIVFYILTMFQSTTTNTIPVFILLIIKNLITICILFALFCVFLYNFSLYVSQDFLGKANIFLL